MTVLVYDGKTLAADKQATNGGLKRTVTKVFRVGDLAVGFSGDYGQAMEMLDWVRSGRKVEAFPASQRGDDWCSTLVIDGGRILVYEKSPYPLVIEDPVFASGSGRGFAVAAMYCGLDARRAVAVACQFETGCGMGIDAIDLVPLEPSP